MTESDYTVKGAMCRLSASRQTIYDLIKTGTLKSYKLKSSTRITAESVEALRRGEVTG